MSLNALSLIALSCAAQDAFIRVPPEQAHPVTLQLFYPDSDALPGFDDAHLIELAYGDAEDPNAQPGGAEYPPNWAPFHTFALMGPHGRGDGPRIEIVPGAMVRVRKPSTPFPVGVRAIGTLPWSGVSV